MALRPQHFSRVHVERVIGSVRVALAASSLFAVWLDPSEPSRYAALTYTLHSIYVVYSIALAIAMWRRDSVGRLPLATHAADIAVASVFQYLTLGPSSPFFIYFVFALFSGALRWGSRGTVRTAAVVLVAFIVMGISLSRTLGPAEFELNRFIIRIAYLAVVAVVLTYLGQHEERLRDEVRLLARWPLAANGGADIVVPQILEHSANIVGSGRATIVWSKDEEPWSYVASWPVPPSPIEKRAPGDLEPLVPAALADATFLCRGALGVDSSVIVSRAGTAATWTGLPVHPGLLKHLPGTGVASTSFRTERASGRIFFGDLASANVDVLPLVEIVGREIGASLDQLHASERSREIAIREDRIRLARDLHDGVLQSLTGIRLELQDIARTDADHAGSGTVSHRLHSIERALALDQRELRGFIEDIRPASSDLDTETPLAERLDEVQRRMALEWRVPIEIRVRPETLTVRGDLDRAVPLMVHEAIVNALKHGQPTRVSVDVQFVNGSLVVSVEDDGRGFSFRGRHDHAALTASRTGPVSLRERVSALGGEIAVDSSAAGSRIELSIPLRQVHV